MSTCPSEALYFGNLNDLEAKVDQAMSEAKQAAGELTQLRGGKETKPHIWFAGPAPVEVEDDILREGESYDPTAYNIHNWKKRRPGSDFKTGVGSN